MLVLVVESLDNVLRFEGNVESVKDAFALISLNKGEVFASKYIHSECKYILSKGEEVISLTKEVLFSDISTYDTLYIIPNIEGDFALAALPAIFAAIGTATAGALGLGTLAATIIANAAFLIAGIAISFAINAISSLLTPSKEFSTDPSQAQHNSNGMFNSAPLIMEQGSSVPLWYGECFIGGVLISSGLSSSG